MYEIVKFFINPMFYILYKIEIKGNRTLPSNGSLIVASNHIHNFDPVLVACIMKGRKINYLSKKEMFKNKFVAKFLTKLGVIPIDRNNNDIGAIKKVIKLLKAGEVLGIFPQGTRMKSEDDNSAKAGMGMFALKTNSSIIPIRISGNYKLFSKITVEIFDIYDIPTDLKEDQSSSNYLIVANEIMKIIND